LNRITFGIATDAKTMLRRQKRLKFTKHHPFLSFASKDSNPTISTSKIKMKIR
jgi:hypothetical protein